MERLAGVFKDLGTVRIAAVPYIELLRRNRRLLRALEALVEKTGPCPHYCADGPHDAPCPHARRRKELHAELVEILEGRQ